MTKDTDKKKTGTRSENKRLSGIQLNRLAKVSGISRKKLSDLTIAEVTDRFQADSHV